MYSSSVCEGCRFLNSRFDPHSFVLSLTLAFSIHNKQLQPKTSGPRRVFRCPHTYREFTVLHCTEFVRVSTRMTSPQLLKDVTLRIILISTDRLWGQDHTLTHHTLKPLVY
jgi:hypothetical protein